jgi:hypothetical protein
MEAFVYSWKDRSNDMVYVGSHKGTLDDGYISSSYYLNKEYKERPQDFTRQIIIECDSRKEAMQFEYDLLMSFNARKNPLFYNKTNGDDKFYTDSFSEETKKKMSLAKKDYVPWNKGKKWSQEQLKNRIGKKRSASTIENMSKAQLLLNKRLPESHKNKLRASVQGKKQSPDHLAKRIESYKISCAIRKENALNGY